MKRRDFFKIMGVASGAALSACKVDNADKKLLPYLVPADEGIIPGIPRYVRSTCMECPAHCGIAVKMRDDKPIKLEGAPDHPINTGALCLRGQASLARLYHPDRKFIEQPMARRADGALHPVSWQEALEILRTALKGTKANGLRNVFLSSRTTGSLGPLIDEFCRTMEMERLKEVEIYNHNEIKRANRLLFGLPLPPHYRIDRCDALLTLGVDLFETFLSPVEWARQYAEAKRNNDIEWHHVEPYLTLTGAAAQRRHVINPGSEPYLAAFLLRNLPLRNALPADLMAQVPDYPLDNVAETTGLEKGAVLAMAQLLGKAKQPLIIGGGPAVTGSNGAATANYTALLQWALGMVGKTVDFDHAFNYSNVGDMEDFMAFAQDCREGKVGVALFSRFHGFAVLPGLTGAGAIKNARFKAAITDMPGPATEMCDLTLPLSHSLESWGDAEPRRGVKCLVQPVIAPLYDSKSEGDILLTLLGREQTYRDYLAGHWQGMGEDWIDKGYKTVEVKPGAVDLIKGVVLAKPGAPMRKDCLFIVPSLRTFDGRSAGSGLLEEIPDPITAISYGKWLAVSTIDARQKNLSDGDVAEVETRAGKFKIPAALLPGLPKGVMTIAIDSFGEAPFINSNEFSFCFEDVKLVKTGESVKLAVLSGGKEARNRGILPFDGHEEYKRHTLYPPHGHKDYRWGMAVDLDLCTGCSACVAACYIENNVPVVGKAEHIRGREMSWLRIESYYDDPLQPEFIPMMCQQCDNAPCESVCPVYATYHSPEGLNAQIYNRCVGTRYCANNCPYKVRRFNWFDRSGVQPLYGAANPDISARPNGVMEKCSFCIQRIRFAKDRAKDENRLVRDGEVIPACAQTCPTGAILFGNLLDPGSGVSKLVKSAGGYGYRVLEQLGTEPGVYYLKRKNASGGPLFEKSGAKTSSQKFLEVQEPFFKKVPGRRRQQS